MSFFRHFLSVAALALAIPLIASPEAEARQCGQESFEGATYFVCTIDPAQADLRLFWRNGDGEPYRSFSNLADAVEDGGRTLVFAMNAGMYETDFSPVGLYVEDGETLKRADTTRMEGPQRQIPNFYKQPNGIFFLDGTGAGILSTDEFLREGRTVRFATQSGPMLVIRGALHPAFIPGSSDTTRRSGVGVCEGGLVRFAISAERVNFHDFARLFRDQLGCSDALFLDGGRGAGVYEPETRRNDYSWHGGFGPIFGLVE